jgi:hypothetical protein
MAIVSGGRGGPGYCETTNVGPPHASGATAARVMRSHDLLEVAQARPGFTASNVHHETGIVNRARIKGRFRLADVTHTPDVSVGGVRADTDRAQAGSAIAGQRIRCARILDTRVAENLSSLRDADLAVRARRGPGLIAAGAIGAALDVQHPNVVLAGGSSFSAVRTGVVSARFAKHVRAGIARRSGLRHRTRASWSRASRASLRIPLAIPATQRAPATHGLPARAAVHASAAWIAFARTRRTVGACPRRSSCPRVSARARASACARAGVRACRAARAAVGRLVLSDRASARCDQREHDRKLGLPAPTHASDSSTAE